MNVPENEWFMVPGTHEAIIERETFEKAQALQKRDTRTAPGKEKVYLMSGLIRCADCKKAMRRKTARNIVYYACRSYTDKKICSKHSIRQDKLEGVVLAILRIQIALMDQLAQDIAHISSTPAVNRENKRLSCLLKQAEQQLNQYRVAYDNLYLDWKCGEITKEEYHRLKGRTGQHIQKIEATISYLKEQIQDAAQGRAEYDPYLSAFLTYKNIQSLNRGIVVELVKTVWIHENGAITIDLNFADVYQAFAESMNKHSALHSGK